MIFIIQIIVIIVAIVILLTVLGSRQSHASRAWKKIALIILAVLMVIAVLSPDLTNRAANLLGIGRGADLLLYLLTLSFIGYVLNGYIHQQKDKDALYRLARKIALLEAEEKMKQPKTK